MRFKVPFYGVLVDSCISGLSFLHVMDISRLRQLFLSLELKAIIGELTNKKLSVEITYFTSCFSYIFLVKICKYF